MTIFSTLATFGTPDTPFRIPERGKQNRCHSPAMNWTILLKLNYKYHFNPWNYFGPSTF